ncbi:hypothetical protein [Acinetobacter nosocomialis]|uniref:hypothetical protein n=1 Tax=Acinetobacter nosocomialis TaxID=106654 RepID=UPI001B811794|nr:hypothetical protein [Acinetobacter nosocomialis]MBR7734364.1 hypothetical protein [Acinetobacter nosocomialis]
MNKIINYFLLLGAVCFTATTHADQCFPKKHANVPNITEKSYQQARKLLIQNKWQPLRTLSNNSTQEDLGYGNGWKFWKKGFKEVESCAATGLAPCVFNFTDVYGNNLKVYTEGEESGQYKAQVSHYEFHCK